MQSEWYTVHFKLTHGMQEVMTSMHQCMRVAIPAGSFYTHSKVQSQGRLYGITSLLCLGDAIRG